MVVNWDGLWWMDGGMACDGCWLWKVDESGFQLW